ncbi:MAG: hypothetical protein K2V38_20950, partial [Gemmataceae bacterium]|nr:hypothetical protein [Gemmataceae bacterium]
VFLALAGGLLLGALATWCVIRFHAADAQPTRTAGESLATPGEIRNDVKWWAFVTAVFVVGAVFVAWMYVRDSRTVRWYVAAPLAVLRVTVYAILCLVFLLPARQTWEVSNRQSRVVILLDISPSVTSVSDESDDTAKAPGAKTKNRIDVLIDFLTDEKVAFLKNLLDKNPVAVYAFGTRLDEAPTVLPQGSPAWTRAQWDAFQRYDFKPFLTRGLSDDAKAQLARSEAWVEGPGDSDWAGRWFAALKGDLKAFSRLEADEDVAALRLNLERLEKRIDVARTITLGTNVPDSITAAINRESANMVQGIIVLSDGRSNLGSESSYAELREWAAREKIPVYTVVVGEDRDRVAITITDVQAPDSAPVDEAWKIIVEADGANLAGKEVEVILDVWMPAKKGEDGGDPDPKDAPPKDKSQFSTDPEPAKRPEGIPNDARYFALKEKLAFAPGEPPHGQAEFVLDPAKLPRELTTMSTDAAIKKRVLVEGKWFARARIKKDPQEAFADPEHLSPVRMVSVVQQKLRILLVAGAPGREFSPLRTLLVREVQDKRATLTTFVQNEAGKGGKLTAEQDEKVIPQFPTKFDVKTPLKPDDPEKPFNFNEYDVIVLFDTDWTDFSAQQAEDLSRWVKEGGGGLIYVAGPVNTFQLARVEAGGRLDALLNLLPVLPDDLIATRIRPTSKTPRRLHLNPKAILGSDLLKLDDSVADDPIAGWEPFFTDRDKYVADPDLKRELYPTRGFFSCYPLKKTDATAPNGVKAGSAVLAEFADIGDTGEEVRLPYLVTNNPSSAWRTCFIGSGEFYRLRAYDPKLGPEYFERIWIKLIKYMGGKRNLKAPRGRL